MINSDRTGKDHRKQAVSIRMSRSDVRHIKRLAERLGARDSDIIRFAIKLMLSRLAPLQDPTVCGRSLVPVFLESGPDLMRHFELDASRLASIINEGVDPDRRVEPEDIQLLALSGIQRSYLKLRVPGWRRGGSVDGANNGHANGHANGTNGTAEPEPARGHAANGADDESLDHSLRRYLYDKYLYTNGSGPSANSTGGT